VSFEQIRLAFIHSLKSGNGLVASAYELLNVNHPLRRFLKGSML